MLAALALTMAWGPLQRKRISRRTALNLPWYLALYGTLIGAAVPAERHTAAGFCGVPNDELLRASTATELAGLALTGRRPGPGELFSYQVLLGLLLSNGPGHDLRPGCEGRGLGRRAGEPERVQLNKAMVGFLTHSGFSHGGNGFEGIQFLLEQFEGQGLEDPARAGHGVDLAAMATRFAQAYKQEKVQRRELAADGARAVPASTTRCSAASRSTPTRARPSSPS